MDLDRYEGQLSVFLITFILHLGHEEAKHSEACLFQGIILWENSGYAIAKEYFFLFRFSLLYSNQDVIPALQGEGSFQLHCQMDSMGTVGTEVNEMDIVFYGMARGVFRGFHRAYIYVPASIGEGGGSQLPLEIQCDLPQRHGPDH